MFALSRTRPAAVSRLHAKVLLIFFLGRCNSGSRSLVLFFFELGAAMVIASTMVLCRGNRACLKVRLHVSKISRAGT